MRKNRTIFAYFYVERNTFNQRRYTSFFKQPYLIFFISLLKPGFSFILLFIHQLSKLPINSIRKRIYDITINEFHKSTAAVSLCIGVILLVFDQSQTITGYSP